MPLHKDFGVQQAQAVKCVSEMVCQILGQHANAGCLPPLPCIRSYIGSVKFGRNLSSPCQALLSSNLDGPFSSCCRLRMVSEFEHPHDQLAYRLWGIAIYVGVQ